MKLNTDILIDLLSPIAGLHYMQWVLFTYWEDPEAIQN